VRFTKITLAALVIMFGLDLVPVTIAVFGLPLPSVRVFWLIELAILALSVTITVRWLLPKVNVLGR
jgi:hypothetical protein